MNTLDTIEYKGFEIEVYADESDWLWDDVIKNHDGHKDYFTTVGSWGGYTLFDEEVKYMGERENYVRYFLNEYHGEIVKQHKRLDYSYCLDDYANDDAPVSYDKVLEIVEKWVDKNLFVLPIYVYEHGGITMSTGGFSCSWDSGQAGYIYSDKKRALALAGNKKMSKAVEARIYKAMKHHVAYCASLCEGSVYGYTWEHGGCGGFVVVEYRADYDYMVDEAKREIDYHIASEHKKAIEKKKAEIKNHVPLLKRSEYAIA